MVLGLATVEDVGDIAVTGDRALPLGQRNRACRVVRRRLIVIADHREIVAPVADVGDVDQHAGTELTRVRHEPALRTRRHEVAWLVEHVGCAGIKFRRVGHACGKTCFCRQEAGIRWRLRDDCHDGLRRVVAQDIRRTGAIEMRVVHAVSAANGGLVERRISEPESRPEVVPIRIHQIAVLVRRPDHRLRRRIEVRRVVVPLIERRGVFVAESDVQRQLIVDADVILHVGEVQIASEVGDDHVREVVLGAKAEHEVADVVQVVGRSTGRPCELPGVGVAAVQRVDVLYLLRHAEELVADFERLPATQPRVVHLGIPRRRELPLRARSTAPPTGVARDNLTRQAAGHALVVWKPADAIGRQGVLRAEVCLP